MGLKKCPPSPLVIFCSRPIFPAPEAGRPFPPPPPSSQFLDLLVFHKGETSKSRMFVPLVSFFSYQSTDVSQQRKAYRILEQICGNDSDTGRKFVASHLKELQEILLKTLASSSSASKTVSTDFAPTKTWW